jgi:6-phosphogluconolactonase (cycloisomerase 2 family)
MAGSQPPAGPSLSAAAFLLAASQDEHGVQVFAVDPAPGALTATEHRLSLKSPVCLCFISD